MAAVIDPDELSATIAEALSRRYRLSPLAVKCTYPVFKGEAAGERSVFVKVGTKAEWERTVRLLSALEGCGLFPRLMTGKPVEYRGAAVFVMEYRAAKTVFPENMTDAQAEGFVAGCVKLSQALERAPDFSRLEDSPRSPTRLYDQLAGYARRHPLAARLLGDLLSVPVAQRTFAARELAVIHGDFHAKNFGFTGDELTAVFDFDKLIQSLACGDFVNALAERFSCLGLSAAARRRLKERTAFIVRRSPWPRADLERVANVIRLEFAARRLAKHPDSAWVALDIRRRDRRLQELNDILEAS